MDPTHIKKKTQTLTLQVTMITTYHHVSVRQILNQCHQRLPTGLYLELHHVCYYFLLIAYFTSHLHVFPFTSMYFPYCLYLPALFLFLFFLSPRSPVLGIHGWSIEPLRWHLWERKSMKKGNEIYRSNSYSYLLLQTSPLPSSSPFTSKVHASRKVHTSWYQSNSQSIRILLSIRFYFMLNLEVGLG